MKILPVLLVVVLMMAAVSAVYAAPQESGVPDAAAFEPETDHPPISLIDFQELIPKGPPTLDCPLAAVEACPVPEVQQSAGRSYDSRFGG